MFSILILLGLIVLGANHVSRSAYQAGWSQGYVAGRLADGGEAGGEGAAAYGPYGPYAPWGPGRGFHPHFGGLGLLFACGLPLLLLAMLFGMFGRHHRRHHGHWGPRHGHQWRPPWDGPNDAPATEKVMKA
jgi:hypothetical protein